MEGVERTAVCGRRTGARRGRGPSGWRAGHGRGGPRRGSRIRLAGWPSCCGRPAATSGCTWSTPRAVRSAATTWHWPSRSGRGHALAVHSAGATLVQPGRGPTRPRGGRSSCGVGAGGRVHWAPEPTVVSDGADYWSRRCGSSWRRAPGDRAGDRRARPARQRGGRYGGTHARRRRRRAAARAHHTARRGRPRALRAGGHRRGPCGRDARARRGGRRRDPLRRAAGEAAAMSAGRGRRSTARGEVLLAVGTPSAVAAVLDAEGRGGPVPTDRSRGPCRGPSRVP